MVIPSGVAFFWKQMVPLSKSECAEFENDSVNTARTLNTHRLLVYYQAKNKFYFPQLLHIHYNFSIHCGLIKIILIVENKICNCGMLLALIFLISLQI